jgi:GT2 family glycosyltransferase
MYSRFRLVDWVTAAAVLIRRDVVDRIGLLPEGNFMYSEDVEFCHRARSAGFAIGYEPEGKVVHRVTGARESYDDWIENYTRGSLIYYAAHYPALTVARVARTIVAGNRLRYSLWRTIGALSRSKRAEAESRCRGYRRAIRLAGTFL